MGPGKYSQLLQRVLLQKGNKWQKKDVKPRERFYLCFKWEKVQCVILRARVLDSRQVGGPVVRAELLVWEARQTLPQNLREGGMKGTGASKLLALVGVLHV